MLDLSKPDSEGIDKLLALSSYPNIFIDTRLQNPSQETTPYRDMWPNRAFLPLSISEGLPHCNYYHADTKREGVVQCGRYMTCSGRGG